MIVMSFVLFSCLQAQPQNTDEQATSNTQEILNIGFIGPLTGNLASLGVDMRNAVLLFLDENPVFAGRKVELVAEDDMCDPSKAVTAANKLISSDKVQVILLHSCSGSYLAVAPIANANKVVIFSSVSTSPEITLAGGDFGFRNAPSDELASTVLIDYISTKYKKIAILSENTDFAQAYRQKIIDKSKVKGLEVVFDEVFNPDTTDFKTSLTKMKESEPEVFLNFANGGVTGGLITKQKYELAINVPEIGTDIMTSKEYLDTAKEASNGEIIAMTSADESKVSVQDFLNKFKVKFGQESTAKAYAVLAYDSIVIMKNAIENVGYDASEIKEWLYTMPEYDGLAGKTKFDSNGDGTILPNLMVLKDGKFEIMK